MTRFISQKFRFFSFMSIATLVFVHGYNLRDGYLRPQTLVEEPLTFTTFIEYFISNGILRFRLPILFIISGYIFALQDQQPYWSRIKKRFGTLMIPFLLWSAIGLGITYLLQQFPNAAILVRNASIDQTGINSPYNELSFGEILFRWLVAPPSFQLWFIRSLFFINMLYPVIKWCIQKNPIVWFTVWGILWTLGFEFFLFGGQSILYFSLGVFLQKRNFPLHKKPKWLSEYLSWAFFIGLCTIKTFMAFELEPTTVTFYTLTFLHTGAVISGITAIWYSSDFVVQWCMSRKWFLWLSGFSFFIYGFHVPLLPYAKEYFFAIANSFVYYRLLAYIVVPVFILFFCIAAGAIMKNYLPRVYKLLTGGRGF